MSGYVQTRYALFAYVILAVTMYLAINAIQAQTSQTLYDNQLSTCQRGNTTRRALSQGVSAPLRELARRLSNTRAAEARVAQAAKIRGAPSVESAAAHADAVIQGQVENFPQVDCLAVIQHP